MARIFHDQDAPEIAERVAVIGYGNQGSSWAMNLRDSGAEVVVGTISDASRERASEAGFPATDIGDAVRGADLVCVLIPDEVMPAAIGEHVGPDLRPGSALCFASGYALAYDQVTVPEEVDVVLVAPRMLGAGVRETYVDGSGFCAFVSVERDATGRAQDRMLAIARGIGATRRGALEMGARQEALLDLFIEQAISPALTKVWSDAAIVLLETGIPLEAVLVEFYLSGEVERAYRALREIGYEAQTSMHSETSQYGTLSRAERFADLDVAERMRAVRAEIDSGAFAAEWAAEQAAGYPRFNELKKADPRALMTDLEADVRAAFEPR